MLAMLAVGGARPIPTQGWDFWLPAYILLSFLLMVVLVRVRITPWVGVACFLAGTVWAWLDNAVGVIPAGAMAVLLAVLARAIAGRIAPSGPRR